jgi:uncharacterized Rmd1/YagE family protein
VIALPRSSRKPRAFGLVNDHIRISGDLPAPQRRELALAASHALMRSLRLEVVETLAESRIGALERIPDDLMQTGSFNLSKKQCLSLIGELMAIRGKANLYLELVEPPPMCWERRDLEGMFERVLTMMDVETRLRLLNMKLDYASELLELARMNLTENQSHRLEMIIIVLIAVEIIIFVASPSH